VQLAVSQVQGLLDVVLEVSTDLSSAAPMIPNQGPGSVNPNQGPNSSKKNPPVEVAMKPINSHAALSDLVTAKLTGMANLALSTVGGVDHAVGRGEGDAYSLLVKGSLPLSFEASLLLIQSAVDMFPTASTVVPEDLCDRILGLESTDVPSGPTHTSSAALSRDLTRTSPAQLAAVPHAVIPLSVRLGGLGHACHQASLTALRALALSTGSDVCLAGFNRASSVESELLKLLLAVFEAYKRIASIDVEDAFLTEAADAAESLIRGECSAHPLPPPTSSSHIAIRQHMGHLHGSGTADGIKGPGSPLSHSGRIGSRLGRSSMSETAGSRGQTMSGDGEVILEDTEESSAPTQDINTTDSRDVDSSVVFHSSASSHTSSAHRGRTLDRPFQQRRSGQPEQSINVGIPMSRLKSKKAVGANWSDESSEESESESDNSLDGETQQTHSTRTVALSRVKSASDDVLSRSVSLLPVAVQDCLDRYDLPCNAVKDYQKEYDAASSGNTIS
jgi:hypothetical protein